MLDRHDEKFLADTRKAAMAALESDMPLGDIDAALARCNITIAELATHEETADAEGMECVANVVRALTEAFVAAKDMVCGKDALFGFTRCMNLYLMERGGKDARASFKEWRTALSELMSSALVAREKGRERLVAATRAFVGLLANDPITSDVMIGDVHREMVTKKEFRETTDEILRLIGNVGTGIGAMTPEEFWKTHKNMGRAAVEDALSGKFEEVVAEIKKLKPFIARPRKADLTQEDVARDLGVSRQTVNEWENTQTTDGPANTSNEYHYYRSLRTDPNLRDAYEMLVNLAKAYNKTKKEWQAKGKRFRVTFVTFQEMWLKHSKPKRDI